MPTVNPFNQPAPTLGNQYLEDRVLRSFLARVLPPDILQSSLPALSEMGNLAGGDLYRKQQEYRRHDPVHVPFDAWGNRIDHIEVSPFWTECERLAAEKGIVATSYDTSLGEYARIVQFALTYLFHPSTDVYSCPLAMTDGAARTLLRSGNPALINRAVPRLTSRNPDTFWTSGQWMTESTGGSDVGQTETVAEQDADGVWRLYGRKWFTSAITAQMALTLARPVGNPEGGNGLALFYIETRTETGDLNNITVHRLKEKLGTKKLPTAELTLAGSVATPVYGTSHGIRNIVPMLHVTRTWNSVCAIGFMRRGVALARDFARKRFAFGDYLIKKPLHADTLAMIQAEFEATFHLVFFAVRLLGKDEAGTASEGERTLFRTLSSIVKLTTGKQGIAVTSEVLESFGGAGYVEDTGLPMLLRDAHVLSIWEGTTNVLSLDTLKTLAQGEALNLVKAEIERCAANVHDERLQHCISVAVQAMESVTRACVAMLSAPQDGEAAARRISLTLGRSLALALLADHAEWSLRHEQDERARAAACRFATSRIDYCVEGLGISSRESLMLANDGE